MSAPTPEIDGLDDALGILINISKEYQRFCDVMLTTPERKSELKSGSRFMDALEKLRDELLKRKSTKRHGSASVLAAKTEVLEKLVIELSLIAISTQPPQYHYRARLEKLLGELQWAGSETPNQRLTSDTADNMQTNSEPPAMPAEANDSRTANDKAVVCKELLGQRCRWGEVYRIYSEQFGTHDVLCICVPDRTIEGRYRFVPIQASGEISEALYRSSVANDKVEKQWPSLFAYYAEVLA